MQYNLQVDMMKALLNNLALLEARALKEEKNSDSTPYNFFKGRIYIITHTYETQ